MTVFLCKYAEGTIEKIEKFNNEVEGLVRIRVRSVQRILDEETQMKVHQWSLLIEDLLIYLRWRFFHFDLDQLEQSCDESARRRSSSLSSNHQLTSSLEKFRPSLPRISFSSWASMKPSPFRSNRRNASRISARVNFLKYVSATTSTNSSKSIRPEQKPNGDHSLEHETDHFLKKNTEIFERVWWGRSTLLSTSMAVKSCRACCSETLTPSADSACRNSETEMPPLRSVSKRSNACRSSAGSRRKCSQHRSHVVWLIDRLINVFTFELTAGEFSHFLVLFSRIIVKEIHRLVGQFTYIGHGGIKSLLMIDGEEQILTDETSSFSFLKSIDTREIADVDMHYRKKCLTRVSIALSVWFFCRYFSLSRRKTCVKFPRPQVENR